VKLRLDPASSMPPYEQLRAQISAAVERGRLLPGDRLPTVRELAAELGLANNTVARAYRELEAAGFVVGRGRLGTFVADVLPERLTGERARLAAAAREYAKRSRQLGFDAPSAMREAKRALTDAELK